MLTVKEINEVSFGKAGFSGYKPEDVDNFIDEVVESFTQLLAERDDALQQEAQLDQQVKELTNQVAQLKAKNAELQKKLGILAQKIESYREEEDGIKEAILSAQKIGKDAIQEAKDKAAVMLADAEENAKALLANARDDAAKAAREYAIQVEQKRNELEEMKVAYSKAETNVDKIVQILEQHLESINHIPSFRFKDTQPAVSRPEPQPAPQPEPEPEPQPVYREEPRPVSAPVSVPEPKPEPEPVPQPVVEQPKMEPAPQETPELPQEEPTLQDKVDYSREQLRQEPHSYHPDDNDLSQVGIDLEAYSDIPESLQREKASHFSNLEFGDDVDLGRKKRRK